jgi:membrane-associated phospholipid phosphatase
MNLETRTAEIFSKLFTPFAVAAIISIAFSWFSPIGVGPAMSPLSSGVVGIVTLCLVPFVPVLYSVRIGKTDLDVSDVTKRAPLYGLGLIGYAIGLATFLALNNRVMFVMALAYLCVGLAMCLITLAWKISAHTAGIAGPTTALVFVFGVWAIPLYALSIFMVWSRVKLHAHTLSQAVAGLIVAIAITGTVYSVFYL